MPIHIPVQHDDNDGQKIDVRTPAQKRRDTIIRTRFNGDEEAYIKAQREQASRGGKNGGRPFRDVKGAAKKAINTRWDKKGGKKES